MYIHTGSLHENEFIDILNNRLVGDVNQNLKFMLKTIYGQLDENEKVFCEKVLDFQKPDFVITYKGVKKYISLKTGRATGVHEEYFKTLIPFLEECGLSKENCEFFLKYCYADGTTDGSGVDSMDFLTLKTTYDKQIAKFNNDVIENKDLIKKVIFRCLFKGSKEENIEADYIYFGTVNYGCLCSKKQIFKHIDRRDWHFMENPHIGPLQFRPHIRGHIKNPNFEKRRHQCDFWWANLGADMEYIAERYDG